MSTSTAPRRATRFVAPLLAIPVVAAAVLAGVWVAGGVITDDYRASMALTAAWFVVAGAACVMIARRSRALGAAVLGSYVVTAGVVGVYLGATTLRDRVVDEQVVTAAPIAAVADDAARSEGAARRASPAPAAVAVARGRFRSLEHATRGAATVVRLADGRRFLTLTGFETSAGPDLRVRLAPVDTSDGGAAGAVDLGALKGNRGDQQYALPRGVPVRGTTVVIWCRAFSAPFGAARL
jgi:hypothetical protein